MKLSPHLLHSNKLTGSISHRSQCFPSINTLERNSLWEEEAVLEEQDAELNSATVSGNASSAKREPDVRVVAQPVTSESRAAGT